MNSLRRFLQLLWDGLWEPPLWVYGAVAVFALVTVVYYHKPMLFILKSLARNKVRTGLTGLATALFVLLVVMVWSVLWFLEQATKARSKDLKAIVTERWQIPSQMPYAYAQDLSEGAPRKDKDYKVKPDDSMTWQFFGGTLEPEKPTRENMIFFFCMEPKKVLTMMDGLDQLTASERAQLEAGLKAM
jgi:putative ABC transport system permease protein